MSALPYSVRLCHLGFALFVLNWIVEGRWISKWNFIRSNPLLLLFPVFFVLHAFGLVYSENQTMGWLNLDKKLFLFLLPIPIAYYFITRLNEMRAMLWFFVVTCFCATVYCLAHSWYLAATQAPLQNFNHDALLNFHSLNPDASNTWLYFSYVSLTSGIQLHPTYFGFYLLCSILIIADTKRTRQSSAPLNPLVANSLIAYFSLFILLLNARVIIALLIIGLVVAFALAVKQRQSIWTVIGLVVLAVLCAALFYINPVSRFRTMQEPSGIKLSEPAALAENSVNIRTSLLWLSIQAMEEVNPWIGAGTGDANDVIKNLSEKHQKRNILNTYDPHNQFIQTFLTLGIVGLVSLLCCFLIPLYLAWKEKQLLSSGLILVFLAVCCTESALEVQKGIAFVAVFLPMLTSGYSSVRISQPTPHYA